MNTIIRNLTNSLAGRSAAMRDRLALEAEMAAYNTESERNDLSTLLDSYPDEQTAELRAILAHQAA